jgi:hypothetical protein
MKPRLISVMIGLLALAAFLVPIASAGAGHP